MGCSKNRVDSEHLMAKIASAGVELLPEDAPLPTEDDIAGNPSSIVDAVIINTCGFIESAKKEAIDQILAAIALKEAGVIQAIVVTGCMSQRYQDEIAAALDYDLIGEIEE